MQKDTLGVLVSQSGYSQSSLQRIFAYYLCRPPKFSIYQNQRRYLIIDGTYFSDNICLVLYYDSQLKVAMLHRYSTNEFYKELKEDLENLKSIGIDIAGVSCDGKKAIMKAVHKVYPEATIQRCIVHVQRMVRLWLTRKPKLQPSKEFRYLIGLLHHVHGVVEQHMGRLLLRSGIKNISLLLNKRYCVTKLKDGGISIGNYADLRLW